MQIITWDNDPSYIDQLQKTLCMNKKHHAMKIEIVSIHGIEELERLHKDHKINQARALFLFHETCIQEVFTNTSEVVKHYLKQGQWSILSEGIWEKEWESIIDEFYTSQQEDTGSFVDQIIHKYQSGSDIYKQLKTNFIESINQEIISPKNATSFITIYKPYGSYSFSKRVLEQVKTLNYSLKNKKILIIHYDSFFHSDVEAIHSLSYLYMQIRKQKTNLGFILNEIVMQPCRNIDVLESALNMNDYDFLTEEEDTQWLTWLKEKSGYNIVIFNLNGVHITKRFQKRIMQSEVAFLYSDEEIIQKSVRQQINAAWHINEKNDQMNLNLCIEKMMKEQEGLG